MADPQDVCPVELGSGLRGLAAGEGEPVLWIHGYTLDSSLWSDIWALLPGMRHIGVDLPGHGQSRPLTASDTLPTITAELLALARRCGARRLVGLSFGSVFALQMALDGPDRFDRLTIAAPTVLGGPVDPDAQRKNREIRRHHVESGRTSDLTDLWLSSPPDIFTGVQALNPAIAARIREIVTRHSWRELDLPSWRGIMEYPQPVTAFKRISAHTQIIVGENDMPIFLRNAYKLATTIPGGQRIVIDGAGHLPLIELPQTCAPLLVAHLRDKGDEGRPSREVGSIDERVLAK